MVSLRAILSQFRGGRALNSSTLHCLRLHCSSLTTADVHSHGFSRSHHRHHRDSTSNAHTVDIAAQDLEEGFVNSRFWTWVLVWQFQLLSQVH